MHQNEIPAIAIPGPTWNPKKENAGTQRHRLYLTPKIPIILGHYYQKPKERECNYMKEHGKKEDNQSYQQKESRLLVVGYFVVRGNNMCLFLFVLYAFVLLLITCCVFGVTDSYKFNVFFHYKY